MNRKDYALRNAMLRDRNMKLLDKALKIVAKSDVKNVPKFNFELKKINGGGKKCIK